MVPNGTSPNERVFQLQAQIQQMAEQMQQMEAHYQTTFAANLPLPPDTRPATLFKWSTPVPPQIYVQNPALVVMNSLTLSDRLEAEKAKKMMSAYQSRIDKYTGKKDPIIINAFLKAFEAYCKIATYNPSKKVSMLGIYLGGNALPWWEYHTAYVLPMEENVLDDWTITREAFLDKFLPEDYIVSLHQKWHNLDMCNGLQDFVVQFCRYLMQIPGLTKTDIWDTLMSKLDGTTIAHLRAMRINTSTEALNKLRPYATILAKDGKKPSINHHRKPAPPSRNSPVPMDTNALRDGRPPKDIINENLDVTKDNFKDFTKFPRLTNKLRTFLAANKGCYYCRELNANHRSIECPKPLKK